MLGGAASALLVAATAPFVAARLDSPVLGVDYLARLDESVRAADPADEAWPLYQRLLAKLTPDVLDLPPAFPGGGDWAAWQGALEAHRDLLPVLLEASRRPRLGMPLDPLRFHESWIAFFRDAGEPERAREHEARARELRGRRRHAYEASVPSLLAHRGLVRLACVAGRDAEARGEPERALQYVEAAHGMGLHLLRRPQVLERMIGIALTGIAQEEANRLLLENPGSWGPDRLRALADSELCCFEPPPVRVFFEEEWTNVLDLVQTVFADDGTGDGPLLPGSAEASLADVDGSEGTGRWFRYARFALHAGRRETLAKLSALWELSIAASEDPSRSPAVVAFLAALGGVRHDLVLRLDPAGLRSVGSSLRVAAARSHRTAATVAAVRYLVDRGAWPARAEDLVPDYLAAIPEDVSPGSRLAFEPAEGNRPPRWRSAIDPPEGPQGGRGSRGLSRPGSPER